MTAVAMNRSRPAPPRQIGELTVSRKTAGALFVLACLWGPIPFMTPDYRLVALPVATILSISTVFLFTLWRWTVTLPVFELGAVFGVFSTLYAAVPAINFMSAGLQWTPLSDGRLLYYNPGGPEVAAFTWPYAAFLAAFSAAYLIARSRRSKLQPVVPVGRSAIVVALVLLAGIQVVLFGVAAAAGINFDPSYVQGGLAEFAGYYRLPYFVQQILHNVVGWRSALKMIFVAILLHRWRTSRLARWTLVIALMAEVGGMLLNMGARTYTALLVLAFILLYHRFIRPLSFRMALIGGLALLAGLTVYGAVRTVGGELGSVLALDRRMWAAANDFQTLFTSAYVVQLYVDWGVVGRPPWEVHLIDFVMLIPSQLLPIAKIDPSTWFYGQLGVTQSSMFGLRAQPVIGFGTPDFALRGVFLGVLFGLVHRWYVRRSWSFWMTALYVFICVWSHYIYRSTMLWPLYFVIYQFVPVMLMIRFGALILQRVRKRVTTLTASAGLTAR